MKARKDPTDEQLIRRMRRGHPESERDPRYKNDPYWALRLQGYPDAYARRRPFHDEPPKVVEHKIPANDFGPDDDDLLFDHGSVIEEVQVALKPPLTIDTIASLGPRGSEYTVWDCDGMGSLGLRIRASGHKSFIVMYRVRYQKKSRKITLGKTESMSLEDARSMARIIRYYARLGTDPAKLMKRAAAIQAAHNKNSVLDDIPRVTPSQGSVTAGDVDQNETRLGQDPPCYPKGFDPFLDEESRLSEREKRQMRDLDRRLAICKDWNLRLEDKEQIDDIHKFLNRR